MKHAIRALGWATAILWILVILFSGTVVYSAMQIGMNFEGEPQVTTSNGTQTISIPFSISNDGLYDISELNITTLTVAENEAVISRSTTLVSLISRGYTVNGTYDIVVSLDDILAQDLTYLLFNDTDLNVDMSVELTYAHSVSLKISSNLGDLTWGAPLSNLTVGEITEISPSQANAPLSFENHAFFGLNGTVQLEIWGVNELIGSGTTDILVPSEGRYDDVIPVTLTGDFAEKAEVRIYFDTSVFSFGPVVIPVD